MTTLSEVEILSEIEIEAVNGGGSSSEYWQDQLLRYKTGLSNVFGDNSGG